MNNLFVSLYEKDEKYELKQLIESKVEYYKYNFLKYSYVSDMLNNDFGKNMSLKLNIDYILDKLTSSKTNNINFLGLNSILKKDTLGITNLNLIFDRTFDELNESLRQDLKEYISNIIANDEINIKEIISNNEMYINDVKYIEQYLNDTKTNKNKLKILIVLNDIKNYDEEKIKEYISNYKFVDILKMSNINKFEHKKIQDSIENINEEYGSAIDIIQRRNIQDYHIYIMFSDVSEEYFNSHYILRKKSKYIDMRNEDMDIYNNNILEYEKNKSYILTLTQRLNIDINKYSKNKIGSVILSK